MLDFFRNYNEQLEILIEGENPHANQLLRHADVDLIRNHLQRDERITAFATGRAVGMGRTIWVVTSQSLLVVQTGKRPGVRKFSLDSIEKADAEKGRYGHALSAHLAGARLGLYGVAQSFAVLTLRALARPAGLDATRNIGQTTLNEEAQAHAQHAFADLTLRAQPLLAQSDAEARQLLQQTADRARSEGQQRAPEAA
ncbi:hypothetical protein [Hydrogenophaga sp.]|nr:hypothetical protein [Hydrogenophaga sp.]MDP2075834.1 hypothetical protein [Hydrogenophaga sp.]MDP3108746.1 hypothetical protein [Hydrogenophaga sp.]MDZ4397647.1 hypothetical protein [Hydrogenophaga sp.]